MRFVLSLISNPAAPSVDAEALTAAKALASASGPWTVLAEGVAAETEIDAVDTADARMIETTVRTGLGDRPIDVAVLPATNRRKKLLVADMDSTIIGQECIDELADFAGIKGKVAAITEKAMKGELPFETALRERVALLKGLPLGIVDEILNERITITPGAKELVRTMRANGAHAALVSGGFTHFTGPIAERVGFDEHFANVVIVENGRLAGRAEEPVRGRAAKLEALEMLRARFDLAPAETLAAGDGANDLAMIEASGLGVAYHAKPAVAAAAHARIDHGDLTALLYLQGYRRAEFAA